MVVRIANRLFLTFPKNVKRLLCSGKGVGVQSVEEGLQVAGSTFERKVNLGYVFLCPTASPHCHILWVTKWVRISTSYLKIMGHLLQDLFFPKSSYEVDK